MVVTDLWKSHQIIKKYGTYAEVEVLEQLRALTWDKHRNKQVPKMLDVIVNSYVLDTANGIYANHKDDHSGEWYMKGHD